MALNAGFPLGGAFPAEGFGSAGFGGLAGLAGGGCELAALPEDSDIAAPRNLASRPNVQWQEENETISYIQK